MLELIPDAEPRPSVIASLGRSFALLSQSLIGGSSCSPSRSWAAPAPGPLPLLGRSRSWAAPAWLSLLSLLTLSLLCASPAHAQYPGGGSGGGYPGGGADSYSVVYSGGTTTVTTANYPPNPPVTNTTPYSASTSTNAPGAWGGGAFTYINGGGGSGSVTCKDKITATFTWNGGPNNDPPPTSAIVTETANVAWGGPGSSGDCGLPNPTTPASQPPNRTATRYTINSGGSSFSVNCTPTASMSGTSPQPYHVMGGSAYVGYTASAAPVLLTLSGTTKDSSNQDNILIGQGCNGSLSAGGFTLSDFQWTIPGETFADYEVSNSTVPINTTVASYGRVKYLSSDDLTSSSPHWYWKHGLSDPVNGTASGEPQTVSCTAQATATGLPVGTVTGQRKVSVWAPYSKFHYDLTSAPPTSYFNWGTGNVATQSSIGFDGTVGIPQFFYDAYASTGIWQFTQLCQLSRVAIPSYYVVTNGYVLDAEFNYSSMQGSPWYADAVFAGNSYTTHISSDNPQQPLAGPPEIGIDDFYWTYMMFQPPGADVSWVPLHKMERHWQAALHSMLSIYWYPTPPGTLQVTSDVPSSEFPIWQDVYIDKNAQ